MTLPNEKKKERKDVTMRKLCFMLTTLLLTAPAFAGVVISCAQVTDTNQVEVGYTFSDDANRPRAYGLDIQLDNGMLIGGIVSGSEHAEYWVYPGTIEIAANGSITEEGTPMAPGGAFGALPGSDSNGMTIEMGSLYNDPCDPLHQDPPTSPGVLFRFTVYGAGDCNVTISGNGARGNVVLEDTEQADVSYGTCYVQLDICPFSVGMVISGDTITQAMRDIWETLTDQQKLIWCNGCSGYGDTNGDCLLDYGNDVQTLKAGYAAFTQPPYTYDPRCDFNKDGAIDYGNDVQRIKANYPTCPGPCTPIP
jgi:hypothetical protein